MNLKEAAARLGVHYQTAYKWVRLGHLNAIRVGGRYEVSEASIGQFLARRTAIRVEPNTAEPDRRITDMAFEDVLEELEAMTLDPFVSAQSVAGFATRRGAAVLGDLCVLTCFDRNGDPTLVKIDHPDPARAARITAVLDTLGPATSTPGFAFSTFSEQRLVRLSHVPQDLLRDQLRPELRQHMQLHPIRSVLAVPITVEGEPEGLITFLRDRSDRPHSDEEEAFAWALSTRVGALLTAASDIARAVKARQRITADLQRILEFNPSGPADPEVELAAVLDHGAGDLEYPAAILDPELRCLVGNRAFHEIREANGEPPTSDIFGSLTHPDDVDDERTTFARLASGELDFLDLNQRRILPNGREIAYTSHRAAVRAPDSSLHYFVIVARPLRLSKDDVQAVAPSAYRPSHTDLPALAVKRP